LVARTERLTADPETTAHVAPETERIEGDAPEVEPETEVVRDVARDDVPAETETETAEVGPVRTTRTATARIERGPDVPRHAQEPQQPQRTEVAPTAEAVTQMRTMARQQAQAEAAQVDVDGWRLGEQAEAQAPAQSAENTLEPLENEGGTAYEEAMSRYRGGQYVEAAAEFERVIGRAGANRELLPSAQHHLARSHRQRGACAAAVNHYERLFQRYPAYGLLPQALIEAADCYRRVGRYSEARAHLHRAAGYNSTSAAARRELTRLDTIERAARRQNTINRARRQSHEAPSSVESQEAY
jgi:TolA-binding protein